MARIHYGYCRLYLLLRAVMQQGYQQSICPEHMLNAIAVDHPETE